MGERDPVFRLSREMTISHGEFFRTLPAAMAGVDYTVHGREVRADSPGRRLRIRLSPESTRAFGPIPLPVTHVEFELVGWPDAAREAFFRHFDSRYQRGGG